jgi:hypothetical protein
MRGKHCFLEVELLQREAKRNERLPPASVLAKVEGPGTYAGNLWQSFPAEGLDILCSISQSMFVVDLVFQFI